MAITNVGSAGVLLTASALGTTSTTTAYTATATAGRLGVITVSVKPSTATVPATITDAAGKVWDRITNATGGTGTTGADVGQTRIAKYVRIFDGTETGPVTATATSSSAVTAAMDVYSPSAAGWTTPIAVTANDSAHGSNCSAASGTWSSGLALNDWVHAGYSSDTDALTTTSAHNIAQTGTTFSSRTARSRLNNSSGNQCGVHTWDASVTTAGGGTAATTMGFTWASSSCGPFGGLRLREQAPTTLPTPTVVDNFNDNSIDLGSWDRWGGAQVNETGGQLVLTTTTTAGAYYGINRLTPVNINGVYVGCRIVSAGNQALTSFNAYPMQAAFSASNEAYWVVQGGNLVAYTNIAGSAVVRATMPYLSAMHVYVAIGISSGQILWLWSTNATSWTVEASFANPFGSTSVQPTFMVGTDAAEGSTTSMIVDDYTVWAASGGTSHSAAAALAGTITLTAAGTRSAPAAGSVATTIAFSAAGTRTALPAATLAATVPASTTAERATVAAADLAVSAPLSAAAGRTLPAETGGLPVVLALAADQARTATAAAPLTATVTPTAAAARTALASTTLPAVVVLAADLPATRAGAAALAATVTVLAGLARDAAGQTALPVVVTPAAAFTSAVTADLHAVITPASAGLRAATATATLLLTITPTGSALRAAPAGGSLPAVVSLAAAATRAAPGAAVLPMVVALTAASTGQRPGAGTLPVVVVLAAEHAGSGTAAAALTVATILNTTGTVSRPGAGVLPAVVTPTAAGARTASGTTTLPAVLVVAAGTGTTASGALPAVITPAVSPVATRPAAAALPAVVVLAASAMVFPVGQAVLTVAVTPAMVLASGIRGAGLLLIEVTATGVAAAASATVPFGVIEGAATISAPEAGTITVTAYDASVTASVRDACTVVSSIE